jgi:hypothetical protein
MLANLWARNGSTKIMASQNFGKEILGINRLSYVLQEITILNKLQAATFICTSKDPTPLTYTNLYVQNMETTLPLIMDEWWFEFLA